MRVGIISVFTDYHLRGRHSRGVLQPQAGPLIAGLLPDGIEVELINDVWDEPDWGRDYDLLFISALHSDFDRARQISHYWRVRGATTVLGGSMASTFPELCKPFFDVVAIGDPEGIVPRLFRDFCAGTLEPFYVSGPYDPALVPTPRLDLVQENLRVPLALEITRGCPFACDFCSLTAVGTRYHTRSTASVVRDIEAARRALAQRGLWHKQRFAVFFDNNLGGSFAYLRELCDALTPLNLRWGSSITFNGASNPEVVKRLSAAGCRFLYVGLESFNAKTLEDMNKQHNIADRVREMIDLCMRHGILIAGGLMLSPTVDDCEYIESIPARLAEAGLFVPEYVSFETPFPGTPHFARMARQDPPALFPHVLLRDLTGYTLTVKPHHATPEAFVDAYRRVVDKVYAPRMQLAKLRHDVPRLLAGGWTLTALADVVNRFWVRQPNPSWRTYLPGRDPPPPERVPLLETDFASDEQRAAVLEPWRVTDAQGRVDPMWLTGRATFLDKGQRVRSMTSIRPAAMAAA
jgi:hypothetical protein